MAHLYLESLKAARSPKAVRIALEKLGTKAVNRNETTLVSSAYDHAYTVAMDRFSGQVQGRKELALETLMWLAFARRPMTTIELQEALAIDIGECALDITNISDIKDILSACIGLVVVDEGSSVARLVHHTAREFFQRNLGKWIDDPEGKITGVCTTCLAFDVHVEEYNCPASPDTEHNNTATENQIPSPRTNGDSDTQSSSILEHGEAFYRYAVRHWGDHTRSLASIHPGVLHFLNRHEHVEAAGYQLTERVGMKSVQLAAHFGLLDVVKAILENDRWELFAMDYSGFTALMEAAWEGRASTVDFLLNSGAEINRADYSLRTALHFAADKGHHETVRTLLLHGANVDALDSSLQTPLLLASAGRHHQCISTLVNHKANLDLAAHSGITPLLYAIYNQNMSNAMFLIAAGANVSLRPHDDTTVEVRLSGSWEQVAGRSALSLVSSWLLHLPGETANFDPFIQLLADAGAEVNDQDTHGRSPLYYAVKHANDATVRKLLDLGANPNLQDYRGESAWSLAFKDHAEEWCPAGVSILGNIAQMLQEAGGGRQQDRASNDLPIRDKKKRNADDILISEKSKRISADFEVQCST